MIPADLSDFHKMIVLKTTIVKNEPKQIIYRDFKYYDDGIFKDDLGNNLNIDAEKKLISKTSKQHFSVYWKNMKHPI